MPTSGVPLSEVTDPLIRVGLAASAGPATSMVVLMPTATASAAPPSLLYTFIDNSPQSLVPRSRRVAHSGIGECGSG